MTQRRDRGNTPSLAPTPPPRQPRTGEMVHYRRLGENTAPCRAAVVTQVWSPENVNLFVCPDGLGETNETVATSVQYDAALPVKDTPGKWHFPE